MSYENILFAVEGGIARLTCWRPINAITPAISSSATPMISADSHSGSAASSPKIAARMSAPTP